MPSEELIQLLEDRKYRVVIDGVYRLSTPYNEYIEYLLQENYELRGRIYGVKIYTWKEVKEEKPEKKLKGKEWKTVGKKI